MSVQDLRQSPQAKSEFYLENIYHIIGNQSINVSPTSTPPPAAQPPMFYPPKYAIWVNSLWFLSLVIGLTCALLATLLQQWARQYIRLTQPARCSIEKRARVRAFFADGVDNMGLPWAMEALPALLHLSLFLFFSGLVIFLRNVNQTVSLSVTWCIGLFSVVYGYITTMPMLWHNSPYYTPLSKPTSYIAIVILTTTILLVAVVLSSVLIVCSSCLTLFSVLSSPWYMFFSPEMDYLDEARVRNDITRWDHIMGVYSFILTRYKGRCGISLNYFLRVLPHIYLNFRDRVSRLWNQRTATEKIVLEQSSRIDHGILTWMIGALDEDNTLEKLLETIPGFLNVQATKGFKLPLLGSRFADSICGFLGRNLLSDSLNEEVKTHRSIICINVVDKMCDSHGIQTFLLYISRPCFNQVRSIQTAQNLSRWCASSEGRVSLSAQQAVACILSYIPERDDRWIALAKDHLGIPEQAGGLRALIADGDDSVSGYFLLHMIRKVIGTKSSDLTFLSRLSRFDIRKARPGLQADFCALWNEIVQDARSRQVYIYSNSFSILRTIRHLYTTLHQGTEAAPIALEFLFEIKSYPLCNIAARHPNISERPPTHPDDPHHPSPGPTPLESQATPGGSTVPQQVEEANIFPGHPPAADSTSHHAQVFTTSFQTTDPVHIVPQAPSVTDPSPHECIEMVPPNLNRLVSTDASGLALRSSLPTADLTINTVRSDERTPDILVNESGENPQTPAATAFTFPHPDPVLGTVTSSTVSRPPSVSVQQPGEFSQHSTACYVIPHIFSSSRRQQPAGYSRAMCCIRYHPNLVYRLYRCHSTNEQGINSRPAHYCIGLPIIAHHDSGLPQRCYIPGALLVRGIPAGSTR